jgi:histone demethylase JARID1
MARWRPDEGRVQVELPEAPTFRPKAEEFADPFGYIMAVCDEIAKQHGICKIIPPEGWVPPAGFSLQQGLQFAAQRQFVSHLCMRQGPGVAAAAAAAGMQQQEADGR